MKSEDIFKGILSTLIDISVAQEEIVSSILAIEKRLDDRDDDERIKAAIDDLRDSTESLSDAVVGMQRDSLFQYLSEKEKE